MFKATWASKPFCDLGRNVCLPNPGFVCSERLLPSLLDILRVHLSFMGLRREPLLRWHQRNDWLLPNEMVEILLDHLNSGYLRGTAQPSGTRKVIRSDDVILGGVYLQHHSVDSCEIPQLRVPPMGSLAGVVYSTVIYVVHSRLHGLDMVHYSRRSGYGKKCLL